MTHSPLRRFTIADAMILTVAGAVGSLLLRYVWPGYVRIAGLTASDYPGPGGLYRVAHAASVLGSCVVIPLMAAQVVARLRSPRPRRVGDEPGIVASLAVLLALVPGLLWYVSIQDRPGFQRPDSFEQVWVISTFYTSTAVPGAWLALLFARRWRSRADWVDRFGRCLGWFWIILLVAWRSGQAYEAIAKAISTWGLR